MSSLLIDDPRLASPQCTSLTPVRMVHENPWFSVCNRGGYYTVEYKHRQCLILPIIENKAILMVHVYRPVLADEMLELPAGGIEANESPVEGASRELEEETGIIIKNLDRFKKVVPLVLTSRSPLIPYIFQIDLSCKEYCNRTHHDDEVSSVSCFGFEDVKEKIANGEIYSGFNIAVITRFFLQKQR